MYYHILPPKSQLKKAEENGTTNTRTSEGLAVFIHKSWSPHTKVTILSRNTIILNIDRGNNTLIVANIYAPADKTKNALFFNKLSTKLAIAKRLSKKKKKKNLLRRYYNKIYYDPRLSSRPACTQW